MARDFTLRLIVALALAIIGAQIIAPQPAAAQAGTCPDVLLDDYGNQYYLPGSQPSDLALCLSDNSQILAGSAFACGVAVWRPAGTFELSPGHEFYIASPLYATVDGPIRIGFTVQAWLDSANVWGNDINDFATNWQYEATTYTPAGAVVDVTVFSIGLPWTLRSTPSLGTGETIIRSTSTTITSVSGGYTRLRVIDYGRIMPPYHGLQVAHAGISQIPSGWTASDPCPAPGEAIATPTPAPSPTIDPSATAAPTSTPTTPPTVTSTATTGPTPTGTFTPFPTGSAVTAVPTATATPYQSIPQTPQPTYTPRPQSTLTGPNMPNLPPISVNVPQLPTVELTAPTLATLSPLDLPAISFTGQFTAPSMISRTAMIEAILTPDATRAASQIESTQWITSAQVMTSGWISETGETLAWIRGEGVQGTHPMTAALTLAEAVAAPVSVARGLELYMPNLWPYIVALLIMLFWVVVTLSAKFAIAMFGVIYRLVDIFIRWFLPGFG